MCGIAGIMSRDGGSPDAGVLDSLTRALRHRGPDGEGRHVAGSVGLIQTRLAIIDLATGDQPLHAGDTSLVANGEIYNYVELRADLGEGTLATRSDCEPPLQLYARYGLDFVKHLRGMYVIALHDAAEDCLVLARDPFGIKPLYYVETETAFAFASEPQALIAAGLVEPVLEASMRDELLQLQFTTGRHTVYQGIHRLQPGETMVIRRGVTMERRRIDALPVETPREIGEAAALRQLDDVLNDSVGVHQRSDVPYGMFLSGGIDSSVLLAMMARLNAEPVKAFTAGFSGTRVHDEREHARVIAAKTGADHTEVEVSEADFWNLLPEIAAAMDDPAADYAVLPTYKLAAAAHEAGLKVVLSGEGGDEMFGGYGRYRRARRPRLLGGRPMRHAGILDGLGILRDGAPGWRDGVARSEAGLPPTLTALQTQQAIDCADWLPNDLLTKLDRCLMAHGVEGRVPFLDPVLADFAFRLPDRLKVHRGRGKWLLRKWLETGLPEADPFSKKRGFTVPVGEWMARRGGELAPLIASQPGVAEVCDPSAVEGLFRRLPSDGGGNLGHAAWALLFYGLWHSHHMLGQAPEGDVFAALAA